MSKDKSATITDERLETVGPFVRDYFFQHLNPSYLYHNFVHVEAIANEVVKLLKDTKEPLAEADRTAVLLAAWFLDTGYATDPAQPYRASADLAARWMEEQQYAPSLIERVRELIQQAAADTPPPEEDLAGRILYDGRYSWLGRKRFFRRSEVLRLEKEHTSGKAIDLAEWAEEMERLLVRTNYLTRAGVERYNERRIKNAKSQREEIIKVRKDAVKRNSGKNYGRGIDTLYRTSFRNHINLSRIADGKANMMISINTIILSILLAVSGAGFSIFEELFFANPIFILPIIILLLSSLVAVVFAVFSARPKVTEYTIKRQQGKISEEASLLYFGNFLKLEKKDFISYLDSMKENQSRLYDDLAKDLYDLGQVLHKKYLLLTISYNTFVGGLILSVLSFLVVYLISIF
jgi:predicted metal-dependent HD superfamily phosphohydrolase